MPALHRMARVFGRVRRIWSLLPRVPRNRFARHPPLSQVSRRTFLKRTGAFFAAAAFGSGCASISRATPEVKAIEPWVKDAMHDKEILTALRQGQSVRKVVEWNPRVRTTEYAYSKERPGAIRMAGVNGRSGNVEIKDNPRTRAWVHTHNPTRPERATVDLILASSPSMTDVLTFVREHSDSPFPERRLRFSHIAAISHDGKVMGYFSMKFGKQMEQIRPERTSPADVEARNAFYAGLGELADALINVEWADTPARMVEQNRIFQSVFRRMHDQGLRIRVTPLPGFAYRDGYFQPA